MAGHPRVFINTDKPEIAVCGYCGLPFVCVLLAREGIGLLTLDLVGTRAPPQAPRVAPGHLLSSVKDGGVMCRRERGCCTYCQVQKNTLEAVPDACCAWGLPGQHADILNQGWSGDPTEPLCFPDGVLSFENGRFIGITC